MKFIYESKRLILKILTSDKAEDVLQFLYRNRYRFEPYEAEKPNSYYTLAYQRDNLKGEFNSFKNLKYIRFFVFKKGNDNDIIGTISFSNILSYPFSCATIGYKFDKDYLHLGYATEAVACAILAVFRDLDLHRIEAYVMPNNTSSIKLLERIGFEQEGLCHQNICICGKYEDHLRFSLIKN
ncbi:MAG: GNAT family N-acetyltransferase [Lachnospiraceae bacterium]|nr:GNAT family N-acetyltransferase [Lachnospiraceae bacterium]